VAGSEAINRMAQYREFSDDWARDEPSKFIDQVPNNRRNQRNFDWQLRVSFCRRTVYRPDGSLRSTAVY